MKMMIAAIALALPAVAHAGTAPAPAPAPKPKMECCCKDMAKPMDCCKDQDRGEAAQDEHEGHGKSGHQQ